MIVPSPNGHQRELRSCSDYKGSLLHNVNIITAAGRCVTLSTVEVWQRRGSGMVSTSPVVKWVVMARL